MEQNQGPKPPKPSLKVTSLYRKEYNGKVSWTGKVGRLQYVLYENSYRQKADDAEFVLYLREAPQQPNQGQWQGQAQAPVQSQASHPYAPKPPAPPAPQPPPRQSPPPRNYAPQSQPPATWDPEDPGPDPEF